MSDNLLITACSAHAVHLTHEVIEIDGMAVQAHAIVFKCQAAGEFILGNDEDVGVAHTYASFTFGGCGFTGFLYSE